MEVKKVVEDLIKKGATVVKGATVKSNNMKVEENYTRLSIVVDKEIDGYVQNPETQLYEKGKVNVVFVSLFTIASILKNKDDYSFAANYIVDHPSSAMLLLSGAKIDIVQEPVAAGEEHVNPFTTKANPESSVYDHDWYANHIVDIELGKTGLKTLDAIFDKMLSYQV